MTILQTRQEWAVALTTWVTLTVLFGVPFLVAGLWGPDRFLVAFALVPVLVPPAIIALIEGIALLYKAISKLLGA